MKTFKHSTQGGNKRREDLLRLIHQFMSPEEDAHVAFDRVNVEGSNVGASMRVCQSGAAELADCCGINIYVSNNIQGVNNSILVGSEVKMGKPGLDLSFGDVKGDRETISIGRSKLLPKFSSKAVVLCALVLVVSLLFALFGPGCSISQMKLKSSKP